MQRGTARTLGSLVEQFQPTVYAISLRRLGNASDALAPKADSGRLSCTFFERITQLREPEQFIAGWLRPGRRAAAWPSTSGNARRGPTVGRGTGILEGASMQSDEPLDQLIDRERAERVGAALAKLKSLDREALDAFYIRGHSLIEITEMLDVPLGTVKRRLHTARKRLKVELESSVADPDEWTSSGNCRDNEDELELVGAGASDRSAW